MRPKRYQWITILVCLMLAGLPGPLCDSWAAENDPPPVDGSRPAGNAAQRDSGKATEQSDAKRPDSPSALKPAAERLKPFTPSEKIEVDQAVDFPYDI